MAKIRWRGKLVKAPKYKIGDMVYIYNQGSKHRIDRKQWRDYQNTWAYHANGKWRNESSIGLRKKKGYPAF